MLMTLATVCLAMNIYHEARDQPIVGQRAVAQVTMNRAKTTGRTVCEVVFRKKQFSWTNTLAIYNSENKLIAMKQEAAPTEQKAWERALKVAQWAISGKTLKAASKATHYHTSDVSPYWASQYKQVAVIGDHIFYNDGRAL